MKRSTPENASSPASKRLKVTTSDEEGWTKVEKRKDKKKQKLDQKHDQNPPKFMYVTREIVKRKEAVKVEDVRDLVLHILADGPAQGWVKVENPRSVEKVVVLLVPGVTGEVISLAPLPTSATANPNVPVSVPLPDPANPGGLPFIGSTFSHACPTRAPGDTYKMHSILGAFFQCQVTGEEKKRRLAQRTNDDRLVERGPSSYLLTLESMAENDYPVPSYMADIFEKPSGWVETPKPLTDPVVLEAASSLERKVYAIDCEMCITEGDEKELTRICIIDFKTEAVIYDQLVKPPRPITDYLTRWSGISEDQLVGVTTTLEQVQAYVLELLTPTAAAPLTPILVGHSLESDLKALKLCHPSVIDTAVLYHHPRGRPMKPGLAWLTKKWCGRDIQTRGDGGHDPEEDARACIELLKKKIEHGPGYGEFKLDFESIFERMGRAVGKGGPGTIRSAVVDHGQPQVMHGSKATTALSCKTDEEVLENTLGALPSHHFVFGRFTAIADALGWLTAKADIATNDIHIPVVKSADPNIVAAAYKDTNARLASLYASLPPRTAFVVISGHSDPRRMVEQNARKAKFDSAIRGGKVIEDLEPDVRWTVQNGRDLEGEAEKAKRGLLFLAIK